MEIWASWRAITRSPMADLWCFVVLDREDISKESTAMPSDLAKKKAAKKKEAAKARQRTKKPDELNGECDQAEGQSNGAVSNGKKVVGWAMSKHSCAVSTSQRFVTQV